MERKPSFSEWLHLRETATSTGDIAGFKRITLPMVQRMWPTGWGEPDPFFKKKKKKEEIQEELAQRYHIEGKEVDALKWRYKNQG